MSGKEYWYFTNIFFKFIVLFFYFVPGSSFSKINDVF